MMLELQHYFGALYTDHSVRVVVVNANTLTGTGPAFHLPVPGAGYLRSSRQILERIPTGRWGRPEDIARLRKAMGLDRPLVEQYVTIPVERAMAGVDLSAVLVRADDWRPFPKESGAWRQVPNALSLTRIVCAPVLVLLAVAGAQPVYTWVLVPALLTDAVDGRGIAKALPQKR